VAITAIIAALYFVLTTGLAPLSFGAVQVRVAEALKVLVVVFPLPAFAGLMIGMGFANAFSPLGVIDMLSLGFAAASLIPMYLLREKGDKAVLLGAVIYCAGITSWVALALYITFGALYGITWGTVMIGQLIAVVGLGFPLYKGMKRAFP